MSIEEGDAAETISGRVLIDHDHCRGVINPLVPQPFAGEEFIGQVFFIVLWTSRSFC